MHRKTTKEILADSFRELAGERPVDKITVKDIVKNCEYSPATFYRQFRDKYDLIAWDYSQRVEQIVMKGEKDNGWRQMLLDGALYYEETRDYLINLLRNTSGHDSFIKYMTESNYKVLMEYIHRVSGKKNLDGMTDLYVRIYVLGTVAFTCEWINGRHAISAEQLAEIHENSLPELLRKYVEK